MKNKFCIIKTTFDSKQSSQDMAKLLLEKKFIACAGIEEIESWYFWEGEVVNQKEFSLSVKTTTDSYKKVEKLILENHPYKIPQILQIPIQDGFDGYLKWIDENLSS